MSRKKADPEVIERIFDMLGDMHSYAEISERLGVSKGQIAGYQNRKPNDPRIEKRRRQRAEITRQNKLARAPKAPPRPRKPSAPPPPISTEAHNIEVSNAARTSARKNLAAFAGTVDLLDLRARDCRYPGHNGKFCGERAKGGSSFCPEHHARCYKPMVRRGQNAA